MVKYSFRVDHGMGVQLETKNHSKYELATT
jgi:hypothetical protein